MGNVRDILRVIFWGACGMVGILWAMSITFIVFGVMGEYNLNFLIILSMGLAFIGYLGRRVDSLAFIWERY